MAIGSHGNNGNGSKSCSNNTAHATTRFTSRGTRATQPLFSDLSRNFYAKIDLNGTPFHTGTPPAGADMKYDYNRISISPVDFFADNLFGAYEYYRIHNIETRFIWASSPSDGVISGDLYTALDKDSRDAEPSDAYINRANLHHREFTNVNISHTVRNMPYMVDDVSETDTDSKDYVQPSGRWWNCENVRNHRWGALRYVLVAHAASAKYTTDPSVFVQHRVTIECRGLKNVVTPSIPPSSRSRAIDVDEDLEKQNRESSELTLTNVGVTKTS